MASFQFKLGSIPVAALMTSVLLTTTSGTAVAGRMSVRQLSDRLRVEIDGALFTEYVFQVKNRPILYPVIGPGGIAMTRNYPMKDVPGEQHDHPHHTSLWYAHGPVNGVDFFMIKPDSGKIVHDRVLTVEDGSNRAGFKVTSKWVAPNGDTILSDTRDLVFRLLGAARSIDWSITLTASNGSVTFGDSDHGGLALRTHPNLQLVNTVGVTTANGRALNSEGVAADASAGTDGRPVWGKRARWIDYWGEIEGRTLGIALLDHPKNPRHPTHWMARGYGYVAACPFGINSFEGKPLGTGDLKIAAGDSVTFRYRVILHEGDAGKSGIEGHWQRYAKE